MKFLCLLFISILFVSCSKELEVKEKIIGFGTILRIESCIEQNPSNGARYIECSAQVSFQEKDYYAKISTFNFKDQKRSFVINDAVDMCSIQTFYEGSKNEAKTTINICSNYKLGE